MRNYFLLIIICLLFFSSCKKEEITYETIISALQYELPDPYSDNHKVPVREADLKVYANEIDYQLDQNELMTVKTDVNGQYKIVSKTNTDYWFRVSKDSLNNSRYFTNKVIYTIKDQSNSKKYYNALLSPLKTFLKVLVLDNNKPAPKVEVTLYLSEVNYKNNKSPQDYEDNSLYTTYGKNKVSGFTLTTDSLGIAEFTNLEPRQYWVRATTTGKNNNNTQQTYGILKGDTSFVQNVWTIDIE